MQLLPAIDVRAGRVVRLEQGDFARERVFADDPVEVATAYARAGADWLHLVDLDGARTGRSMLPELVKQLLATGLKIQAGGGLRSDTDVQQLLEAGAGRVVIGSLAVRDAPQVCAWLRRFGPERVTVALDVRRHNHDWQVASAGWMETSGVTLDQLLPRYVEAGLRHLLCTDIERDGTLKGPNFELYRHVRQRAPGVQLQVSGGVRALNDIKTARDCGAAAVVLGRALLEGRFSLAEALAC